MTASWQPDVLGEGFEQLTLPLGEDDEGEVVATLVRSLPAGAGRSRFSEAVHSLFERHDHPFSDIDVLYVHGWSDYFFQKRLARFWTDRGATFYALDLRKYGRSLREGQTPGYITDLSEYDADISAAMEAMGRNADGTGERRLVLFGHSTGGLTLSLWAGRHPDAAAAVILNAPWLELQVSGVVREALAPVFALKAALQPRDTGPQFDLGFYSRAMAEVADADDPMEVDLNWRPEKSMAVYAGWMQAIVKGHSTVVRGVGIPVPVLVMLSARFVAPLRWSEELTRADTVIVVDNIARASLNLGASVTVERIEGALHDVFISRRDARELAYERLERWTMAMLARRG